jgi:hypothetical protein
LPSAPAEVNIEWGSNGGYSMLRQAIAGCAALLLGAGGAAAQVKSALTSSEIAAVLADAGMLTEMTADLATGTPVAIGQVDKILFYVRALDCAGDPPACENLMFMANWNLDRPITADDYVVVNRFNDSQLFGRAYVLPSKDQVGVEYVIELGGGVAPEHISRNVSRWAEVVAAFIANFSAGAS